MFYFLKNKETLLKNKIQKLQLKSNYKPSTGYSISVAILTTNTVSQSNNLQELIKKYFETKVIKMYSYKKFNKQNEPLEKHFSEKDFSKRGKVLDASLTSFLNEEFDLLIGFFDNKNVFLEYATAMSKATCKAGFVGINSKLFDIEISSSIAKKDEFLSELKKYLLLLNKTSMDKNLTVKVNS